MAQVQIPLHGEVHLVQIENISAGGLLVRLDRNDGLDLSLGAIVQVFLAHPTDTVEEDLCLAGDAEVVRMDPGTPTLTSTIALMWCSSEPAFVRTLAQLLDIAKRSQR